MESLRRTVAIVEDDASMRRSVLRLLNAHGFLAEEYTSAESFLGRDAGSNVECLVLDVDLGGMSGIELQRRLKEAGSGLPVIFITALEDDTLEVEATQAGCIAYLRKPFPAALLIDAINDACKSQGPC
ncbi:response regulator [Rhizobium sp. SEMIA 4085]|uniref:Response regulator CheY-like domain-containing protein n=1 Tax=Rhizobium gallicum bv. gallicum R602sp TaxID=1041138 RepID=A0A0B4X0U2_9HYPH|nr:MULTISPECIES: response regulator [Rhizobium]AJD40183.1 response regulator CheY-like domain-containing protein [Rhizobium gallicum bv. gallicum R602sp]NNH29777.1 response regulator [Rhizobium sp. SEMIA 4085]